MFVRYYVKQTSYSISDLFFIVIYFCKLGKNILSKVRSPIYFDLDFHKYNVRTKNVVFNRKSVPEKLLSKCSLASMSV